MKNLIGAILQLGALVAVGLVVLSIPYGILVGMNGNDLGWLFTKSMLNSFVSVGLYVGYCFIIDDNF